MKVHQQSFGTTAAPSIVQQAIAQGLSAVPNTLLPFSHSKFLIQQCQTKATIRFAQAVSKSLPTHHKPQAHLTTVGRDLV